MNERLDDIRNIRDIQGSDGNWNFNEYMQGFYNGLELAVALMEEREPEFKKRPEVWGKDKTIGVLQ